MSEPEGVKKEEREEQQEEEEEDEGKVSSPERLTPQLCSPVSPVPPVQVEAGDAEL